jgi:type I restriction enzyme R subunit
MRSGGISNPLSVIEQLTYLLFIKHLDELHTLREHKATRLGTAIEADLTALETILVEIGEEDGASLLKGLLAKSDAKSLSHFVRGMVGLDRSAAQALFAEYLSDRSLSTPQIRFIEMVIDQLTARGVMDASALYESPFNSLHSGGPDALFEGKENVIEGVFEKIAAINSNLGAVAGGA